MTDTLKLLRELQAIDDQRARYERDLIRIPKEQQARSAEVDALRVQLDRARDEVKRMKAEEKSLEVDIQARAERIEKLVVQANMARDTSTLLATNHQMQSLKDENSRAEDRALGLVDRIGELEKTFAAKEAAVAAAQAEYEAFAANCRKELEASGAKVKELEGSRATVAKSIEPEFLESYQRIAKVRSGQAVCAVEDDVCIGCSSTVTPNDLLKIRGAKTVVACKTCQRILFLPD